MTDNVSKEFAGLVGDEWHEWIDTLHRPASETWKFQYKHMCSCGSGVWSNKIHYPIMPCIPNRNYTIELIKARIQARGDWDKFKVWLWNNTAPDMTYAPFGNMIERMHGIVLAIAETLTTPALLMQAYIAYRRQV